jgi:Mn-dependent DtxR family transcriptional regulator
MRTLSHMAGIVRGRQAHERMERVMDIAREKGMIDNVGVRLALRVSRTSATRYLSELVREGRLTHHRKGNNVEYRVVG